MTSGFPVGRDATVDELDADPYPLLARLRATEPVSWLPVFNGWVVTGYDLAVAVLRDPDRFTVDDPRFSTALLVGPSMLSRDGTEHSRHRRPFLPAFRPTRVVERFTGLVERRAARLVAAVAGRDRAELRGALAAPLAVEVIAEVLGLRDVAPEALRRWYAAIAAAVAEVSGSTGAAHPTAGQHEPLDSGGVEAFGHLRAVLAAAIDDDRPSVLTQVAAASGGLTREEVISNAAVVLFGAIDTTEGMILNALRHLLTDADLSRPGAVAAVCSGESLDNAIEESLRLEPAAALVDRYATCEVELGSATIRRGDRVSVSLTAANRDPAVFPDPDRFDIRRGNARQGLAFARGPHSCPGAQLARIETRTALRLLFRALPSLRLDPASPSAPRGVVFRKPPVLDVWTAA